MIDATLEAPIAYHITPANARELAAKSLLARHRNKAEAERLLEEAALAVAKATDLGQYPIERLARVRLQLNRLDAMALKENDPQKLDRLASAQDRLSEQERKLAGRPLPGSNKPTSKSFKPQQPPPQSGFSTEPTSTGIAPRIAPRIDDPNEPNG